MLGSHRRQGRRDALGAALAVRVVDVTVVDEGDVVREVEPSAGHDQVE